MPSLLGGNSLLAFYFVAALVCLAPVALLYWLFANLNYFQLEGTWRGIVASGPIAAYVFLYWLTLRHFLKSLHAPLLSDRESRKVGEHGPRASEEASSVPEIAGRWNAKWTWFDSDSQTDRTLSEHVTIEQHGRTVIGEVRDDDGQYSRFRGEVFERKMVLFYTSRTSMRGSCGAAALELGPDGRSMVGHQIYYDLLAKQLMSTKYDLSKIADA